MSSQSQEAFKLRGSTSTGQEQSMCRPCPKFSKLATCPQSGRTQLHRPGTPPPVQMQPGQDSHLIQGLPNYRPGRDQSGSLSQALTGLQEPGQGAEQQGREGSCGGFWGGKGRGVRWGETALPQAPRVRGRTPRGQPWASRGRLRRPSNKLQCFECTFPHLKHQSIAGGTRCSRCRALPRDAGLGEGSVTVTATCRS